MGNGGTDGLRRAVFLDRDGVLNRAILRDGRPCAPARLEEFEILPEAASALGRLKEAGFVLVVATNQGDVARGTIERSAVEAMHARLRAILPVDRIEVCWEVEAVDPRRYKPGPGMLLDAAAAMEIDLAASYMVGDRWRDVDCGRNAGCYTVLVDRFYDEPLRSRPDAVCRDVAEAAEIILTHALSRTAPP